MGFDCHEGSTKFCIEWGAGIVANKSTEGCIRSSRAATVEPIAEKASPADPLTCLCEPFVDSTAA